ncbi:MAG: lysozyme inhibitor LprI family protein [Pseudomonadota bacterium]
MMDKPGLRLTLAILLAFSASSAGLAQDKKEDWPEGSAMHTAYLLAEKQVKLDPLLEKRQAELVALVAKDADYANRRIAKALSAQHASWLTYRNDECELVGSLTKAGGTWPTTHALECKAKLTEARARAVDSALACIKKKREDNHEFEEETCLYPLAPLARGK